MKNRFNEVSISIVLACMIFVLPASSRAEYSVLWDTTHGIYNDDYHPDTGGRYEDMADYLTANDFTVSTTDPCGFTDTTLLGVDVAVVCVMSAWDSAYSAAEVDALTTFVDNGGGLLIMSEIQAAPNGNIEDIATEFDIDLGVSDLSSSTITLSDLADHPVFDEVETVSLITFFSSAELGVSGDAYGIAWQDTTGDIAIAANESYGSGRVIVLGDSAVWTTNGDNIFYQKHNQEFALNTFTHLAVPEPATIILVGAGAIAVARRRRSK